MCGPVPCWTGAIVQLPTRVLRSFELNLQARCLPFVVGALHLRMRPPSSHHNPSLTPVKSQVILQRLKVVIAPHSLASEVQRRSHSGPYPLSPNAPSRERTRYAHTGPMGVEGEALHLPSPRPHYPCMSAGLQGPRQWRTGPAFLSCRSAAAPRLQACSRGHRCAHAPPHPRRVQREGRKNNGRQPATGTHSPAYGGCPQKPPCILPQSLWMDARDRAAGVLVQVRHLGLIQSCLLSQMHL
jgi:hypothetical protein